MRGSRKKMITVTVSQGIRKRVDQFLTSQYQAWKEKREPRKNFAGIFTCGDQTSNALIMQYIRSIYNQYNLPDPLESRRSFDETHKEELGQNINSQFIIDQPSQRYHSSSKYSPIMTESKINKALDSTRLKQTLGMENTPIRKPSERYSQTIPKQEVYQKTQPTHHKREKSQNPDRIFKFNERGEPIRFTENDETEQRFSKASQQIMPTLSIDLHNKQPMYFTPTYTPKQAIKPENSNFFKYSRKINNTSANPEGYVPEKYRYCIACQKPVLDANIERHEKDCEQFSKVYQYDLNGIMKHLSIKIQSLRSRIKDYSERLEAEDREGIKRACQNMNNECDEIMKNGKMNGTFINNYSNALKISKKWCDTTEQINKLRWFIRIREQVKNHFNI